MSEPRIAFEQVSKRFQNTKSKTDPITAVENISFSIRDGECVSLIGPSGCGKSTLLNMGSGLYQPSSGRVFVDGKAVDKPNPHVAFMLQKDLLLPWRNIRQNVEFGLQIFGVGAAERKQRALQMLAKCHLLEFAEHYPHQLSGGMRQRAALARTLVVNPSVLLMDEPFSALDAQTKMVLQQDLAEMVFAEKKTTLFITHDLVESVILSDRILVMSARPGTIIDEIKVDLPERDNPNARRLHQALADYIPYLMQRLNIGANTEQPIRQ